jgi:hypothetical protein
MASLFKLKSPPNGVQPNFILKWGPPASGKGSHAVAEAIEALGQPMSSYIKIGIDDLVESTTYFKKESLHRAQNVFNAARGTKRQVNSTNTNSIIKFLNKIPENNALKIGGVYTGIRETVGSNGAKLSNKLNDALKEAIKQRKNITFETTGMTGWPLWLFDPESPFGLKAYNYNIHIVFPLVPFLITWRRYRQRAAYQFRAGKGIRFAASRGTLRQQYVASYREFENLFRKARNNNILSSVTVLPYNRRPITYIAKRRNMANMGAARLRNRSLLSVLKAVSDFRNSANQSLFPNNNQVN